MLSSSLKGYRCPLLIGVQFFVDRVHYAGHQFIQLNECFRTLAKSVVVLIPLFGVYFILVAVPIEHVDDKTSFVLLFVEMFFNSYQVSPAIVLTFHLIYFNIIIT